MPKYNCFFDYFAEMARLYPNNIAISVKNENDVTARDWNEIDYSTLYKRVEEVENYFYEKGMNKSQIVILAIPRSINLFILILAFMKMGIIFIPVDIMRNEGLPANINFAQIAAIFVDDDLIVKGSMTSNFDKSKIVRAKDIFNNLSSHVNKKNSSLLASTDPAYIMYTSGTSNDERKGVVVGVGGLPYCLEEHIRKFNIKPNDNIAQLASISFDAFIIEMMAAFGTGARLCVVPSRDSQSLNKFYFEQKISIGIFTPAMLQLLNPHNFPATNGLLRAIAIVGDCFSKELVRSWENLYRCIFNGYGLTETTVCATLELLENNNDEITLGQPIESAKFFFNQIHDDLIKDEELHMVELEPEKRYQDLELLIAGPCLALEYWNLPNITAIKFKTIEDPVKKTPIRIYRTGDLVSGCLTKNNKFKLKMQGRVDSLVKIDGERVDVAALEHYLVEEKMFNILKACIVPKSVIVNGREDKFLIGYIVHQDSGLSDEQQIKLVRTIHAALNKFVSFRRKVIPAPAHFVFLTLNDFPSKNSDKNTPDRKLLSQKPMPLKRLLPYREPRLALEKKIIAKIKSDILPYAGLSYEIGADDLFEDLGFRSLHYAMLLDWIEKECVVTLKFSDFNTFPTPCHLASAIERMRDTTNIFINLSNYKRNEVQKLYLVHSMFGDAHLDYSEIQWDVLPLNVIGINARALEISADTIPLLTRDYVTQILKYENGKSEILIGGFSSGGLLAIEIAHQLSRLSIPVRVILFDTLYPTKTLDTSKVLSNLLNVIAVQLGVSFDKFEKEFHTKFPHVLGGCTLRQILSLLIEALSSYKQLKNYEKVSKQVSFALQLIKAEEQFLPSQITVPIVHFVASESARQFGHGLGFSESYDAVPVLVEDTDHFSIMKSEQLLTLLSEQFIADNISQSPPSNRTAIPLKGWDMPLPNAKYFSRTDIDSAIVQHFKNKDATSNMLKMFVLYGLSGTGKSEAALNYLNTSTYKFKAWFRAERIEDLKQLYIRLGQRLHLFEKNKITFDKAIEKVIIWFSQQTSLLLVFDNAIIDNFKDLRKLFPDTSNGTHILITSENTGWETMVSSKEVKPLNIKDEAEAYIKLLIIDEECRSDNNSIKKLAEKLAGLPLAATYACAYINECQITVAEYLEQFKAAEENLLYYKPALADHVSVRLTWEVTLKQLKQNKYLVELLNIIAFLDAEDIPEFFLQNWLENTMAWEKDQPNEKSRKANFENVILKELRRWSLIKRHAFRHTISIHRLFLQILRLELDQADKTKYLTLLLAEFDKSISEDVYANEKEWNRVRLLLPHAKRTAKYAIELNCQVDLAVNLRLKIGRYRAITERGYTYGIKIYKKALQNLSTTNNLLLKAKVLLNLGAACVGAAKFEDGINHLSNALIYFKTQETMDDYVKTLNTLGNAYLNAGKYDEALVHYNEALPLTNRAKPEELPRTMLCIGAAHLGKKNNRKADEMLNKAVSAFKSTYNDQHVRVAESSYFIGILRCQEKKYGLAEEIFLFAYKIFSSKDKGDKNIDTAQTLTYLAWSRFLQGKYDDTHQDVVQALDIFFMNDQRGNYHRTAMAFSLQFIVYDHQNNPGQAISSLRKMLEHMNQYGDLPIVTSVVQGDTPHYDWKKQGVCNEIAYINEVLGISKILYGEESFHCIYFQYRLGISYMEKKDCSAALKCFELAIVLMGKSGQVEQEYLDMLIKSKNQVQQVKEAASRSLLTATADLCNLSPVETNNVGSLNTLNTTTRTNSSINLFHPQ